MSSEEKIMELQQEVERLKADNQILKEALQYMAGMYDLRVTKDKYDDEIEYSCNGYIVNKETWLILKKAEEIIG